MDCRNYDNKNVLTVRAVEMFGCPEKIKNMPKIMNNSTTINVKEIIFRLRERGVSFTDIAYALGKKEDAVRMMFNRYEFVRDLPQKTIVTARLTDGVIGRQIKAEVKLNRLIKVKDIKFNLEQLYGPSYKIPSETTIREYLNDRMYKLAKASNKQLIHPRNVQKRFEFAVSTIEKPAAYFDRIIWSDETTVRSHPTKNQLLFWHHSTHPDMQEVINGQVQGGGISVMFWGCFTSAGVGPLVALEGSLNQSKYIDLLEDYLIPSYESIRDAGSGEGVIFMQDNAPCHKARSVADFFAEKNISVLEWPPQSPDLNPIENLWAILKKRRVEKFGIPTSKGQLIDQIMDIWNSLTPEFVRKFSESTPRRLAACIEAQGRNTKY